MRDFMSQKLLPRLQTIAPVKKAQKKQKLKSKTNELANKIKQDAQIKIKEESKKAKLKESEIQKKEAATLVVKSPERKLPISSGSKRVYELRDTPNREKRSARAYLDNMNKL